MKVNWTTQNGTNFSQVLDELNNINEHFTQPWTGWVKEVPSTFKETVYTIQTDLAKVEIMLCNEGYYWYVTTPVKGDKTYRVVVSSVSRLEQAILTADKHIKLDSTDQTKL